MSAAVEEPALPLLPLRLMSEGEDAAEDGLERVGLAMAPADTDERAVAAAALESNGLAMGETGWVGGSDAALSRTGDGDGGKAANASLV